MNNICNKCILFLVWGRGFKYLRNFLNLINFEFLNACFMKFFWMSIIKFYKNELNNVYHEKYKLNTLPSPKKNSKFVCIFSIAPDYSLRCFELLWNASTVPLFSIFLCFFFLQKCFCKIFHFISLFSLLSWTFSLGIFQFTFSFHFAIKICFHNFFGNFVTFG